MADLKAGSGINLDQANAPNGDVLVKINATFSSTSITTDLTNTVALTGTGSEHFIGNTGFVAVTGYVGMASNVFTFDVNGNAVIPVDGYYKADGYLTVLSSANNATVGIKFSFNGSILSPRPVNARMPNAGDYGLVSGNGSFYATAGTIVGVAIACDKNTTLTIPSSTVDIVLLKAD
jgi:hypothetical protein